MEELLTTKLFIPLARTGIVSRPRLIARLDEGLHQKLTLISAPAGFGKTTLVIEWLEILRKGANQTKSVTERIGWLSLDEADNDPTRFLTYFITALNQIDTIDAPLGQDALNMLRSPHPPPTETTVTSLINEMAAIPGRLVLILDDYHLIEAQTVHNGLSFLLDNMPPQMHLVIATREDPPLHLARLRARDQLTELRAMDLRFTSSEAAEFLNQVMGLNLSTADIVALDERTEGWIAGLQLAAISMQGHEDASGLIKSFTGSHRFVLDYLIEEVLEQQPASVQNFLLRTAILSRLTGHLCNAVTDQENGQTTLEMLDHANLFIVPLDEERRWYRYHHLFADLLRQRLRQTQPDQLPILYSKAGEWYGQHGFTDEAIEFALRAEAFAHAARLIEGVAETAWVRGEDIKLRHWLDRLPAEIVATKPQLCIFHAWSLLATGQRDAANLCLHLAEQTLDARVASMDGARRPDAEWMKLSGRVAATRAFMAFYRGDVPGMVQFSRQALEYLPAEDLSWRSTVINALGDAHDFNGEVLAAYQTRLEAVAASKAAGNSYQMVIANLKLAITLRQLGELPRAIEICQQQLQFATEHGMAQTIVAGWLLAIWGEMLAELNDLDGAVQKAQTGVALTEHGGDLAMLGWSYLCLLRVLFSRGDLAGVDEIIKKVTSSAQENGMPPWITSLVTAWQVRLWLAQDKLGAASRWVEAQGLNVDENPTYLYETEYIVLARVLIAQGRLDKAIRLLPRLRMITETRGQTSRLIGILNLEALALHARGESARALTALAQSLTLAKPGGFVRAFVDEGPAMEILLKEFTSTNEQVNEYVKKLLAAFGESQVHLPSIRTAPQIEPLIEPLSEREIEVLQLIAEGLTNQEIATKLYLSLNTVKVHTRNINGKLDVHNRTKAVASARALGVLPST